MAKDHKISPEDSALFREAIGAVRRLKHDKVVSTPARTTPAPRRQQRHDELERVIHTPLSDEYHPLEATDETANTGFVRPGIQQGVLRKLRRGQFAVAAELDLHGLTVAEARIALLAFLQSCSARGARHVRIIHGQGNSSHQGRPVLKGKVHLWLQQLDGVLAFCPARPEHGGGGALYVLLKRG